LGARAHVLPLVAPLPLPYQHFRALGHHTKECEDDCISKHVAQLDAVSIGQLLA
jgi:hypothetical protein